VVSPFVKLVAGMAVSLQKVYTFLAIAWFWEIEDAAACWEKNISPCAGTRPVGYNDGRDGHADVVGQQQSENFRPGADEFRDSPMFFASFWLYPIGG